MDEYLFRTHTGVATQNTPGVSQPTIIVDGNFTGFKENVAFLNAITSPVKTSPTRIGDRCIAIDTKRVVSFKIFSRNVFEKRPPGMTVHSVTHGPAGNPSRRTRHYGALLGRDAVTIRTQTAVGELQVAEAPMVDHQIAWNRLGDFLRGWEH